MNKGTIENSVLYFMLKLCNIRRYKYILNNIFYKLLKLHNIESQYTLCNSCSKTIPCVFHRSRTSVSCTLFYQFCGVNRELQSRLLLGQEESQGNFRQNPRVLRRPVELHISSWSQNKHGGKNTLILFYKKDVKNQPGILLIFFFTWNCQSKCFWLVHTSGTGTAAACSTGNCREGGSSTEHHSYRNQM